MARLWRISFFLCLLAVSGWAAKAERTELASRICGEVEKQAAANAIDPAFFARLLWRESVFDPNVVSVKGAQGIAQFMPDTAAERGLVDPFDPIAAVGASASYLADLRKRFGNYGLAAAAYNAGEGRVDRWLADDGGMPEETRSYVAFITGKSVEDWKDKSADFGIPAIGKKGGFSANCVALALRKQQLAGTAVASAPLRPWGALIAANFNEGMAVKQFRRLKLRFPGALGNRQPMILRKKDLSRGTRKMAFVMLGEKSQAAAAATCQVLNAAGAPCIVRKN